MSTNKPVICFITGSAGDWGGASRVLYTILRLLDRDRLEPLLLLPRNGPIEPELQANRIDYRIWGSLCESGSFWKYAIAFLRALKLFRQEKVGLVHLNFRVWRPAEVMAARFLRIPVVVHYHVINDSETPADKLCRAAIAVSCYTAEMSKPPQLEKLVIYNPIDMVRFARGVSMREELSIESDSVVVSFLGQIRDIKGVQDFISMARLIPNPDATFLIAGECRDPARFAGSYSEADLEHMIAGDRRIRYIGRIEAVEDVYATSDIVVVPSRWQEPLGLIALEAGACRKPVVATRVGGIPEVIDDARTGFLVEPADVGALVERVGALVTDPELRHTLGEAAYRRVAGKFAEQPVRRFEDVLLQLASEK